MPTGTCLTYTGGHTHRPLPLATDQTGRAPSTAHTVTPKSTGLDFDALLRRCDICGQKKPGRLTRGACADCAPHLPTPAPAPVPTRPAQGRAKRKGGARKGKPASPSPANSPKRNQHTAKGVDEHAVIREYQAGDTAAVIATRHNLKPKRVRAILDRNGIPRRDDRIGNAPRSRHWAPEEIHEIVRRYTDGEPTTSLGRAFKANPGTINQLLRAQGVPIRPPASAGRAMTPHDIARATELYQAGQGFAAIAESLHVGHARIRAALVDAGVEIRPAGGSKPVGPVAHYRQTSAIRAWAHEQGLLDPMTKTGRLPKAVVAAYATAHPTPTQEEGTNA